MNPGICDISQAAFADTFPLLGRPTPVPLPDSGRYLHPEAEDWRTRVIRNGGSASLSTLVAVSNFCHSISAVTGLRSKLFRLNLLCGDNLLSCLVPLYRGQSLDGAQLGGAVDANNGPFVRSDYKEQGVDGGLRGNAATKFLSTGYSPSYSVNSSHLSISGRAIETSGEVTLIGAQNPTQSYISYVIDGWSDSNSGRVARIGGPSYTPAPSSTSIERHFCAVKVNNALLNYYRDGVNVGSGGTTVGAQAGILYVFASNSGGTAINFSSVILRMYSIGASLTAAETLSLSSAVLNFNYAMGRL